MDPMCRVAAVPATPTLLLAAPAAGALHSDARIRRGLVTAPVLELPGAIAMQSLRPIESRTMRTALAFLAAAALLAAAGAARAHVVLEYQVAPADASYKATFKVGHGCGASPTRQVSVAIPAGMRSAKPMPKPGWTVEIQRDKLAQPVTDHGRTITEDVVRVTWTARSAADVLPPDQYDEFVLVARTPAQAGPVYWPVSQVCESGRLDWVEVPKPGQKLSDLKSPAALLDVLPAAGGHRH